MSESDQEAINSDDDFELAQEEFTCLIVGQRVRNEAPIVLGKRTRDSNTTVRVSGTRHFEWGVPYE